MMGTKSDMYVYVVQTIEEPSAATNGVIRLRPYSDHNAHARRRCSIIDALPPACINATSVSSTDHGGRSTGHPFIKAFRQVNREAQNL